MIRVRTTWNGDPALARVVAEGWESLRRATLYFHGKLQEVLNVSAKVGKGTKAADYQASAPGDPPRKRTGWLQKHMLYEFDRPGLRSRVGIGAAALYGLFLEFGTKRMAARPWLLATLQKFLPQIQAQAGGASGKGVTP